MRFSIHDTFEIKWTGKTWSCIGDSITEVNFRATMNYHDYIKNWIGCKVNNYGISGTGWRTPSFSGGTDAIYRRLSVIDPNSDLITIFAGTNDWAEVGIPMTLGAFGDTSGHTSFYGAVEETVSTLRANFPNTTIAVITPIPRADAWDHLQHGVSGVSLQDISTVIASVADKYSIPILDLYNHASPLAPWDATNNQTYFSCPQAPSGDGLHPNEKGHLELAYKILPFINTL